MPKAEVVFARGEQVEFCRDLRPVQSLGVDETVADRIYGVVPSLSDEGRRSPAGDPETRIERIARAAQVARIHRDCKVRATADRIDGVDGRISRLEDVADLRDQIAAGRKSNHSDLVRIDLQLARPRSDESDRPLRILEGPRDVGRDRAPAFLTPIVIGAWDSILRQDAGDPLCRQPIADFGAPDGEDDRPKAAAREDDHGRTSADAFGREHGHGRRSDIEHGLGVAAADRLRCLRDQDAFRLVIPAIHILSCPGPDRGLLEPRRRLPDAICPAHGACGRRPRRGRRLSRWPNGLRLLRH